MLNRGTALASLGRNEQALADFDAALALMPDHPAALYNRGNALSALGRTQEALAAFDRALAAAPTHVQAWNNRGRALQALNRHADAVASFDKAIALQKDYADANFNRALSLLTLGDLSRGFAQYEWRWKRSGMTDTRRGYGKPLWLGEYPLARKTILLHAEQGLGDTIQFARYAPLLARAGATVRLEVPPELKTLLAGLEGVASCHARGETLPAYDVHCPLGSLPLALKTEPGNIPAGIPYLHADEIRLAKWRSALAALPGKRVALAWAGNVSHANDRNRSIDLKLLEPLFSIEGISFLSIQRELRGNDAEVLARHANVTHLGGELADMADTAAVAALADLTISVDTVGGASRRQPGAAGLGDAALRAGLALDSHRRQQPLVSAGAAVPSARARRLAERDRDAARGARALRRRRVDQAAARMAGAVRRLRMALEPIARRALGAADFGVGHLLGDFAAQPRRIGVSTHGRDVEPLVRLDQIDRDTRPGRIVHAEREAALRVLRFDGISRRSFDWPF